MFKQAALLSLVIFVFIGILPIRAEFYPERMYQERKKTSLNFGWKFTKEQPGSPLNASSPSFNEAGWETVNIPHSASYDRPVELVETQAFQGVCWYRKTFSVPAAKHHEKLLVEFEGAMQTADVWLNGTKLGTHDNSGYTWFSFDITDKVKLTGDNILVVRLDNIYSEFIPPGRVLSVNGNYPDYLIFSGIYRNVWLVQTNECAIPLWSQYISTPVASAASAQVRVKTPVASKTGGTVSVTYAAFNPGGMQVFTDSISKPVVAGQTILFDNVAGTIASPSLWSCETPSLYTLYTRVYKDGVLVDDNVDRFGVRWITWTSENGFALNDKNLILKGAALHQSLGWIENALPRSRFAKEVALVKSMGANLIRCAHFPRNPSFYNACDELGMLSMVEVPTWGTGCTSYPLEFWNRLKACIPEMIQVGYNHPSIISWGIFNEPWAGNGSDGGPNYLRQLHDTTKKYDSTRLTYLADNMLNNVNVATAADIEGLNYNEMEGPAANVKTRLINTEYHEGWRDWCYRGGPSDNEQDDGKNGYAMYRWHMWDNLISATRINKIAGACMWSFNDYTSKLDVHPMGVVDAYRIPKAVYYVFRKFWTGVPSQTPVVGLTPVSLHLTSDMTTLISDSTDVAIVTASFLAADGRTVDTKSGPKDSIPVTFTITGPADVFGEKVVKAYAGKCAIILKSRNSPGTITVSASANSLTSNSVTLSAIPDDNTPLPIPNIGIINKKYKYNSLYSSIKIRVDKNKILIQGLGSQVMNSNNIFLVNIRGQRIACPVSVVGKTVSINTSSVAMGFYTVTFANGKNMVHTVVISQ